MTPEEREWTQGVHQQVMELLGIFGNIERHVDKESDQAKRPHRRALAALALAQEALNRLNATGVAEEVAQLAAGGYDLAALSTATPAAIED